MRLFPLSRPEKATTIASALEAERFDRYGLDQAQLRMSCNVIRAVITRYELKDMKALSEALRLYPMQEWHVDRQLRAPGGAEP